MKHVADALTTGLNNRPEPQPEVDESILHEKAIEFVNNLFVMFNTHITFFKLNHTNNQAEYLANKREWVKTFQERMITLEQVQVGAGKIRRLQEPLKNITPAEFLKMCFLSPDDFGLPHVNDAYNEAIANYGREKDNPVWTHAVVRHAAYYSKSFELMTLPRDKSFALFEHNYQQAIKLFINGELGEFKPALTNGTDADQKNDGVVMDQYKQVRNSHDAMKMIRGLL